MSSVRPRDVLSFRDSRELSHATHECVFENYAHPRPVCVFQNGVAVSRVSYNDAASRERRGEGGKNAKNPPDLSLPSARG